jgi:hypothetical protein
METHPDWPIITPCLVFPTLKTCAQGTHRYAALVFAERGRVVLYAAEYSRRFGVGVLDSSGVVVDADQYSTLDAAARVFLAHEAAASPSAKAP